MARAYNVHIVLDTTAGPDDCVVAAFTVKHECERFMHEFGDPLYTTVVIRDGFLAAQRRVLEADAAASAMIDPHGYGDSYGDSGE